jgi:hypothetical protein
MIVAIAIAWLLTLGRKTVASELTAADASHRVGGGSANRDRPRIQP